MAEQFRSRSRWICPEKKEPEKLVRNTLMAKRVADLVFQAALESDYPKQWPWSVPLRFYLFEASDGSVDADQMSSLGTGWWLAKNSEILEILYPFELLPSPSNPQGGGELRLPSISFLVQHGSILIGENYLSFGYRRRCSLAELDTIRFIDQIPVIWSWSH